MCLAKSRSDVRGGVAEELVFSELLSSSSTTSEQIRACGCLVCRGVCLFQGSELSFPFSYFGVFE